MGRADQFDQELVVTQGGPAARFSRPFRIQQTEGTALFIPTPNMQFREHDGRADQDIDEERRSRWLIGAAASGAAGE